MCKIDYSTLSAKSDTFSACSSICNNCITSVTLKNVKWWCSMMILFILFFLFSFFYGKKGTWEPELNSTVQWTWKARTVRALGSEVQETRRSEPCCCFEGQSGLRQSLESNSASDERAVYLWLSGTVTHRGRNRIEWREGDMNCCCARKATVREQAQVPQAVRRGIPNGSLISLSIITSSPT